MEVYKCLDDIIHVLENDNPLLKAKDCIDNLILIDTLKLKKNTRLEGANVFKLLFGLSDNSPYGDYGIEIDSQGYLTILKELNISSGDWNLLVFFLEKGKVPNYDIYLKTGRYETCVQNNLESINRLSSKLGGIPSFDLFYENFINNVLDSVEEKIEQKNKKYNVDNPSEPKEDEKNLFQWAQCTYFHSIDHATFQKSHKAGYGWNFTKQIKIGNGRGYIAYYRREWKWTEYDEGETDSEDDEEENDEDDEHDEEEQVGNQSAIYATTNELPPWDQPQAI